MERSYLFGLIHTRDEYIVYSPHFPFFHPSGDTAEEALEGLVFKFIELAEYTRLTRRQDACSFYPTSDPLDTATYQDKILRQMFETWEGKDAECFNVMLFPVVVQISTAVLQQTSADYDGDALFEEVRRALFDADLETDVYIADNFVVAVNVEQLATQWNRAQAGLARANAS
eukprot:TRINITY_DN3508_c0_g1_i1.p1 TRINITY_DN3508_c0_g1~~TRINITY_DN3508_c0_g1_i1.p1  ORF type:complete len:172 (+),score=32.24 TRINITY_DN3508_c0_g1_i1:170-685(+)